MGRPAFNYHSYERRACSRSCIFCCRRISSALAWENHAKVALWNSGGTGFRIASLKTCRPVVFTFHKIAFEGIAGGYDLVTIPPIKNETQRLALALFREAHASNNDYLSFLFFWQVIEVDGTDPIGFVDRTYRKQRSQLALDPETMSKLPLANRTLGKYLSDDCRHAIAHIRRSPGKKNLDVDKSSERLRLARSVTVIKEFAEYYIRDHLDLDERLYLCSRNKREIPRYIDSATLANSSYEFVGRKEFHLPRKRVWKARVARQLLRSLEGLIYGRQVSSNGNVQLERLGGSSHWCKPGRKVAISSASVSVPRLPGPKTRDPGVGDRRAR